MKAPDKIKIVRFSDTKELSDYWVLENRTKNEDIEYIRKDTILELLQNRNKEINGTSKAFFRSQELQEIYWRINEL